MKKPINLFVLFLIVFASCRESFEPPVRSAATNFLVVKGFINTDGRTDIALSRTSALRDSAAIKPEQGAAVTIMGEDNVGIQLFENTAGHYESDSLVLNKNQKYRLRIQTNNGKEYLSDFAAVKQTPAIDSVNWQDQDDGVHIFVNTHNAQNNTLYYKWDYIETWELDSHYYANFKYFHGDAPDGSQSYVAPRDMDEVEKMRVCWINSVSSNIHIGSSAKLASDIIYQEPIINIPRKSDKISERYSILVKQYALDKQAYGFYQLMQRNSESIGSIFDAQPSDISGNIHCISNATEKVIGYIGVSTEQRKRIFITNAAVGGPQWGFDLGCKTKEVINNPDSLNRYLGGGGFIPYSSIGRDAAFNSVTSRCADCRERGGNNDRPDFW